MAQFVETIDGRYVNVEQIITIDPTVIRKHNPVWEDVDTVVAQTAAGPVYLHADTLEFIRERMWLRSRR